MARASEDLTFKYARQHVAHYREEDDKLIAAHREAMDCFDCEAYLQLGIDAFNWLVKADAVIRRAIYRGVYEYDPDVEAALQELFRGWLEPCPNAEKWIMLQEQRGYTVSNVNEFRNCCEEVKAIVKSFDETENDRVMSEPLIRLRDQAVQEHQDGQTAEFV
jgi:hypothetical protein